MLSDQVVSSPRLGFLPRGPPLGHLLASAPASAKPEQALLAPHASLQVGWHPSTDAVADVVSVVPSELRSFAAFPPETGFLGPRKLLSLLLDSSAGFTTAADAGRAGTLERPVALLSNARSSSSFLRRSCAPLIFQGKGKNRLVLWGTAWDAWSIVGVDECNFCRPINWNLWKLYQQSCENQK